MTNTHVHKSTCYGIKIPLVLAVFIFVLYIFDGIVIWAVLIDSVDIYYSLYTQRMSSKQLFISIKHSYSIHHHITCGDSVQTVHIFREKKTHIRQKKEREILLYKVKVNLVHVNFVIACFFFAQLVLVLLLPFRNCLQYWNKENNVECWTEMGNGEHNSSGFLLNSGVSVGYYFIESLQSAFATWIRCSGSV